MKRARAKTGSVVLDKRIKTWNFFWWDNGKRRSKLIGSVRDYPTKTSAWHAAKALRQMVEDQVTVTVGSSTPTVHTLIAQYRTEKMPQRYSTRRSYDVWLNGRILPRWGTSSITELQARPVELWLDSLTLAPKTRAHIRGLLGILWDFAMWRGDIPTQRNPMTLVKIKGATKRIRIPRSLTVEQFQRFVQHLEEPFRTMALICVCFGLRISECLALRWTDVDWLRAELRVERGIVRQRVDDVKTINSERVMGIDRELLEVLKAWKQMSPTMTGCFLHL